MTRRVRFAVAGLSSAVWFVSYAACLAAPLLVAPSSIICAARVTMSFAPGDRSRLDIVGDQRRISPKFGVRRGAKRLLSPSEGHPAGAQDAKATPGPGFTTIDGVLTYPAPARFQPKNLKPQ